MPHVAGSNRHATNTGMKRLQSERLLTVTPQMELIGCQSNPDLAHDLLHVEFGIGDRTRPDLACETLLLWKHTPVRRRLALEPLEVIDLIPLVLLAVLSMNHLHNITLVKWYLGGVSAVKTHVCLRNRREPQSLAILNDRMAPAE